MSLSKFAVEASGMKKCYLVGQQDVWALRHVDLTIERSEMVAIMGPSGSGKSTLMHLLGCLDRPSEGKYLFDGEDVSKLNDNQLSCMRASKIGFVFQAFNLIPQLTVLENVQLPFIYQKSQQEAKKVSLESIQRVGLSHRLHHRPSELSGGEMQRVAIARALSIKPALVLADEPTGNLDFETSCSILKLFQDLNSQGTTIVLVTHDDFVGKHCKRRVKMRDGLIVEDELIS